MMEAEEYDKIQFLLGKKGKPRPKTHIFDFTGMMKCGECGASITAETKIKRQKNGNIHTYVYYHCTKRMNPNCTQGSIEEKQLKKQIIAEIKSIEIPPEFHSYAMKWLKKENEKEIDGRNAVVKSNEKAYKACLAKIDGLTDMRAGGEISAEEFAERKIKFLAEKKQLTGLFENTDKRVDRWLNTADEMLTFIENAKDKLNNAIVLIDGSGEREFRNNLSKYLKHKMNDYNKQLIKKVKMQTSHSNCLLQLADYVAGSINRSYSDKKLAKEYRKIIAPREISVEIIPK